MGYKKSWYSKNILSQNAYLNELVDWTTDEKTFDDAAKVLGPQVVDFDELAQMQAKEIPIERKNLPTISQENIDNYLVDDLIEKDEEQIEEGYYDGDFIPSQEELQEMGIEPVEDPIDNVDLDPEDIPDFGHNREALNWAIDNNRVIKISYTTVGKTKKPGTIYDTGINIARIVEPHHIFTANNGHDILVTYDRSVRQIRAFRVDNITNIEFTNNRKTKEPSYFKPRLKIKNPGEIEAMNNNIFQNLKNIGDKLEQKGLSKTAGVVTSTMSNLLNIKTAQYIGPQGYWIRQKRCWDNCYRQKRTTSPNKAAQTVWTECWEEYNNSINNNTSGWGKYAKEDPNLFKYASEQQKQWILTENKKFAQQVKIKLSKGISQGSAIYDTLEDRRNQYNSMLVKDAEKLSKIAENLQQKGEKDLSLKVANVSVQLLKEAQFWNTVQDVARGVSDC